MSHHSGIIYAENSDNTLAEALPPLEHPAPPCPDNTKILNRLKRLEGQVRGLQRMIEDDRNCKEILTLLSGVRSALDATADAILEGYLERCQAEFQDGEGDIKEVIKAVKLARG